MAEAAQRVDAQMAFTLAAVGIGLIALGNIIDFFGAFEDLEDEQKAGAVFSLLGGLALVAGLLLAGLLGQRLTIGVRVALLVAAAFFAGEGVMHGVWSEGGVSLFD